MFSGNHLLHRDQGKKVFKFHILEVENPCSDDEHRHDKEKTLKAYTAQKMKLSRKDFFSKCDQIHRKLRIWSHLLKKSLMENFIFLCSVTIKTNVGNVFTIG